MIWGEEQCCRTIWSLIASNGLEAAWRDPARTNQNTLHSPVLSFLAEEKTPLDDYDLPHWMNDTLHAVKKGGAAPQGHPEPQMGHQICRGLHARWPHPGPAHLPALAATLSNLWAIYSLPIFPAHLIKVQASMTVAPPHPPRRRRRHQPQPPPPWHLRPWLGLKA